MFIYLIQLDFKPVQNWTKKGFRIERFVLHIGKSKIVVFGQRIREVNLSENYYYHL